jgi:hypothetical protein
MPTYEVTAPNGKKYQIAGDGTAEQALAHFQQRYTSTFDPSEVDPSSQGFKDKYGPTAPASKGILTTGGEFRDVAAGAGKSAVDLARGAGQIVGRVSNEDVQASRELDAPLMASGAGKVGNIAGNIAVTAPALAIPGANTVIGAATVGGVLGALQPTTSTAERVTNTAVGAVAGGGAQLVGQKIAGFIGKRIQARTTAAATQQSQNAVRDATLAEARRAGYVVPPSTTNPTVLNRIAESVSGKAATQQTAAVRNQSVTNRLIRTDLGLPESAPLTRQTLDGVRKQAGNVYKAVKSAGEITVDSQYLDDLAALTKSVDEVAQDFPDANVAAGKEVNELVDTLLRDRFRAGSAVEYTKQLRHAASANLAHGADPTRKALGLAQRDAAGALEEMVFRHLKQTGRGRLADRFEDARVLIAKTYTVEGALNPATGNVVATSLGRELKRGKPLTGGIATAAKFAQAFPKAAREITESPGVSAVDALVGGVGAATVNPAMVALPAARIGARSAVLSPKYQSSMGQPNYSPGTKALSAGKAVAERAALPAIVTVRYPEEQEAP